MWRRIQVAVVPPRRGAAGSKLQKVNSNRRLSVRLLAGLGGARGGGGGQPESRKLPVLEISLDKVRTACSMPGEAAENG